MENSVFIDCEDLDRIDVVTSENISTHSEHLSSLGSRNLLTERKTNYHRTCESQNLHECIELSTNENILRRKSSVADGANLSSSRVPTPINMMRRWSQSLSRFSKEKRSTHDRPIYSLPSRNLFEADSNPDPGAELEQLVHEIEQHDYLMQTSELSKHSRLEKLRALPQPLSVKRLLKAQISLSMEQKKSNNSPKSAKDILKSILNILVALLLKLWRLVRFICDIIEIWHKDLKIIEGHFGSNVCSYFKFLRWLFAFNFILFIFPLCFITIPQILYIDDVRWRSAHDNESRVASVAEYSNVYKTTNVSVEQSWSIMNLLTGEGMLKSSLLFYGSYSNVTFHYRDIKKTYSIPNAYYMTMLTLYLSIFVVFSTSVARTYRRSFYEISSGIRSVYASKICFAWDYNITDRKAAELKQFSIYTELKEILAELSGAKTKFSIWYRIRIFCIEIMVHLIVCAITMGAGWAIWLLLEECGDTSTADLPWDTLYVGNVVNLTILLLQTVFSWISSMESYRSPRHTLHITLVRNFLLESAIIGVLLYYWITRKHAEGWETTIGQEIYRLIISDFLISLLLLPIVGCLRVFFLMRFYPNCDRPDFDISLKSLGLVFNQTLLWVGLFFAPLLAGVMVIKLVVFFYINKAMLMYVCKSPRHVWRSAQTPTLYTLFSFLSLLGIIIALGYIMTQIPLSQFNGPFRDQSYMFQIFIDGVLRLRQHDKIWSTLMFLIRPAVVGVMLVVISVMVYYLRAKSRAHCMMVKILKDMIYLEVKDKQFLLANIAKITKNRQRNVDNIVEENNVEPSAKRLQPERSPTWQYTRKRVGKMQQDSENSMDSATSIVSSADECVLRNRNV